MKGKILLGIIPVLLLIAGLSLTACKCHHRRQCKSPEKRSEKLVNRIAKKLDLDETQKEKLNRIKDDILVKHEQHKGLAKGLHQELRDQLKGETIDTDKLNELFSSKEKQITELRGFMVNKLAEFHAMLTPGQREKLLEKMDKLHKKHGKGHCLH